MRFNALFLITASLIILLLSIQYSQAAAFEFEKQAISDVVAEELNISAKYNLTITNTNVYDDYFKVYSIVDLKVLPVESFLINGGSQRTIVLEVTPLGSLKQKGLHRVQYYIKGDRVGALEDSVVFDVYPIKDIIDVKLQNEITRDDVILIVNVTNKKNIDFGSALVTIEFPFLTSTKNATINPLSSQVLQFELDSSKLKSAKAGSYNLKVNFLLNDEYTEVAEKSIDLKEFSNIVTSEKSSIKFFGLTKTITKKNDGNSPRFISVEVRKSGFERAFSIFNIQPTYEKESGGFILVGWQRQIEPGESFTIEVTTDYTVLVVILAILIASFVSIYLINRPRIILRKKAIYVKTKGNEFATKIVLFVKNVGKEAKDVVLRDRLPHIMKLHERFGSVKPDRIERNMLEWQFNFMMPGDEKVASYIIYSDVHPFGRIELPQAVLTYIDEKEKRKVSHSNRIFVLR